MSDGIIIVDDENLVVGVNDSANKFFPVVAENIRSGPEAFSLHKTECS